MTNRDIGGSLRNRKVVIATQRLATTKATRSTNYHTWFRISSAMNTNFEIAWRSTARTFPGSKERRSVGKIFRTKRNTSLINMHLLLTKASASRHWHAALALAASWTVDGVQDLTLVVKNKHAQSMISIAANTFHAVAFFNGVKQPCRIRSRYKPTDQVGISREACVAVFVIAARATILANCIRDVDRLGNMNLLFICQDG